MYLRLIANDPYPKYEIYEGDQLVIRVKIDPEMQAVRLISDENRRVFFITEEKVRKSAVFTLVNEYSQPLGTLVKDKSDSSGEIEVEGLKLKYELTNTPDKQINLFKAGKHLLNCKIENEALLSALQNLNYLLFGLSWFALLVKEKNPTFQLV